MADNKKQHYVPKSYMERFSDSNLHINLFNLESRKEIKNIPFNDQFYENYFYGKDLIIEHELGNQEGIWKTSIDNFLSGSYSNEDAKNIKEFVIFQITRTTAFVKEQQRNNFDLIKKTFKMYLENNGEPYLPEYDLLCFKKASETFTPADSVDLAKKTRDQIDDLTIYLVNFKTKNELISSDNPIIQINPFCQPLVGLGGIGFVAMCPLNSHQLLLIKDTKMYPGNNIVIESSLESDVLALNEMQIANAEESIFYTTKYNIGKKLQYDGFKLRQRNLKRKSVESLGNSQKMFTITHNRTILYYKSLSFLKIRDDFKNLKGQYIEVVPRIYDEEWDKKLKDKYEIIAGVLMKHFENINEKERQGYIKGYKEFHALMKKYWNE